MNPIVWLKLCIRNLILRKKFPNSVIHVGAFLDNFSTLDRYSVVFGGTTLIGSSLGAYSYIQSGSVVCNTEIGKFCSIASNVNIGLANHPMHMVSTSPVFYDNSQPLPKFLHCGQIFSEKIPKTIIGADVWIGHGVVIIAGVTIGVGAVIGAGSIVTKDVPSYAVVAGNPCSLIRHRFEENIILKLMHSKWWESADEVLEKRAHTFSDIRLFLTEFNKV